MIDGLSFIIGLSTGATMSLSLIKLMSISKQSKHVHCFTAWEPSPWLANDRPTQKRSCLDCKYEEIQVVPIAFGDKY